LDNLTATLALAASLRLGSFGSARSFAFFARRVAGQGNGFGNPFSGLFQVEGHVAPKISTASDSRTRTPTSKKVFEDRATEHITEGFEDITDATETRSARGGCMPELIVSSTLFGVRKNLVGFGGLFEFVDRVGVSLIRIRVVLHGQLSICLSNLILGC
jgi:hypothetical protein